VSLVSEALRKARRHADGAGPGPGAALPPTLVLPPRRHRAGLTAGMALAVAAAAGLAGAAGVWLLVGRQHREPAAAQVAAAPIEATPVPATAAPIQAPPAAAAARPAPVVPAGAAASAPAPPPAAEPSQPAAAAAARPEREGEPASSAPVAVPREGSYLIDADLGYVKLHLDYLVYRPGSPFGRVNGQDVVTGTTVSGFVVEEITVDHIKLADKRHTVILRVR
jgi:hypothetical protein